MLRIEKESVGSCIAKLFDITLPNLRSLISDEKVLALLVLDCKCLDKKNHDQDAVTQTHLLSSLVHLGSAMQKVKNGVKGILSVDASESGDTKKEIASEYLKRVTPKAAEGKKKMVHVHYTTLKMSLFNKCTILFYIYKFKLTYQIFFLFISKLNLS